MALRLTSAAARATAAAGRCMSSLAAAEAYPAHVLNVPATEVTTLSNGVRVATEGGHGETATVGVYIDAGSRYETPANNGVAHFLEHMNFKGTNSRTKTDLEVQVENMGGHLNAYTSREQTVYYAKVLKQDVGAAVDLLADMLTGSKYDEGAIETERGVILRELEEVNKMPEEVIFDRLHETAYQGSSLGYTILGSPENIGSITRADLADYVATHYTGPRIVVAGAGALDHGALVELADKAFGSLPSTPAPGTSAVLPAAPFVGSDIRVRDDSLPTAHVALAFETGGWLDGHSFPLMVLQQMLGQWDRADGSGANVSAALCRDLAAGPYVHSTSAFNTTYKDTGLFGVYFTADPTDVFTATAITMHNLARLATDSTDVEVERAKQQLATAMTMSLDGTTAVCEDIGRQMLTYGRRMTPAEVYARIAAVDIGAVQSAAMAVIHDQDLAAAGIGNVHEMPDYNYLRRRTYFTST